VNTYKSTYVCNSLLSNATRWEGKWHKGKGIENISMLTLAKASVLPDVTWICWLMAIAWFIAAVLTLRLREKRRRK
jgi:hypothetical protein